MDLANFRLVAMLSLVAVALIGVCAPANYNEAYLKWVDCKDGTFNKVTRLLIAALMVGGGLGLIAVLLMTERNFLVEAVVIGSILTINTYILFDNFRFWRYIYNVKTPDEAK